MELARRHLVAEGLVRPGHWVSRQERRDGVTDRRRWESALFLKVRDEIQTANLAIDGAKNFGRFEAFFQSETKSGTHADGRGASMRPCCKKRTQPSRRQTSQAGAETTHPAGTLERG